MSGGSLDYSFRRIEDAMCLLRTEINPGNPGLWENQYLFLQMLEKMDLLTTAMKDIEWELSCDTDVGDCLSAVRAFLGHGSHKYVGPGFYESKSEE